MIATPATDKAGLWFAAQEAHGALVGQWLRSTADYVIAIGPFWTTEEQAALTQPLPDETDPLWIVIDAPASVTLARAQADPSRGLPRDPGFHHRTHRRFHDLLPSLPAHRTFDSQALTAEKIAAAIADILGSRRKGSFRTGEYDDDPRPTSPTRIGCLRPHVILDR
jgi:hypothetical protein